MKRQPFLTATAATSALTVPARALAQATPESAMPQGSLHTTSVSQSCCAPVNGLQTYYEVHGNGGAGLIQQVLLAGLVDELDLDVMPVFLGAGLRLFDNPALEHVRLEKISIQEIGVRTSMRFRIMKDA